MAKRDLPPGDPKHGTPTGYTYGCRCDDCRLAMREYRRAKRVQGLAADDPRHGTVSAYQTYACRCEVCREGARARREAAKARGLAEGDPRHGVTGYTTYGCRCEVCKAGQADFQAARNREQFRAVRLPGPIWSSVRRVAEARSLTEGREVPAFEVVVELLEAGLPAVAEAADADLRRLIVSRVAAGETRKHVAEALGLSAAHVGKVVRAGVRPRNKQSSPTPSRGRARCCPP